MTSHSGTFVEFDAAPEAVDAHTASAGVVRFVRIPAQRFFLIEGSGPPGDIAFREAMAALYPVAWTLHFALKSRALGGPIGALEGVYWTDDDPPPDLAAGCAGAEAVPDGRERAGTPGTWPASPSGTPDGAPAHATGDLHWRLMLPVPADAREADILAAIADVRSRKDPIALPALRVVTVPEGPVAQVLHVGPYDRESPTIERLRQAILAAGLRPCGPHHEIYISDPNRTSPERLKTVIRQPVVVEGPG